LDKLKQAHKIDVVVALSMAALAAVRGQGESTYLSDLSWVSDRDDSDDDAAQRWQEDRYMNHIRMHSGYYSGFPDGDEGMKRRRSIDDDDPIVPDGGVVRSRIVLMDGRPINARDHQPHYGRPTANRAAVTAAYDSMCARLTNSWRLPSRDAAMPDLGSRPEELMRSHLETESSAEAQAKRDRIWQQYRDDLSRQWMMGRTNPQAATAIERQRRTYTYEGGR
jgi:hypothetical protein